MLRMWFADNQLNKRFLSKLTGDKQLNAKIIFSRRAWIAAAALALCATGHAQPGAAWPNKPVRFVVPYTPGGSNDVVARIIGQKLSEYWGQPVLVENKPGVGGNIGAAFVARSAPDGSTLLITPNNLTTMNPYLYSKDKLGYDVAKDFEPISMLSKSPILLAVNAKLPVNSIEQLVAYAKANPGRLSYASAGVGTPHHLTAELFKSIAGIDVVHIPYRGASPAVTDLAGGQVQMMFGIPNSLMPFVKTGQLRALGVSSKEPAGSLPGVPTVAASYPGFNSDLWIGLLAPAGTPKDITAKIRQDIVRATKDEDVKGKLAAQGLQPEASTGDDLKHTIQIESARWSKIILDNKITAE